MLHSTLRNATATSLLSGTLLFCGVLAVASPASAAPIQGDAKEQMQKGLEMLRRGEDEKALEVFRSVLGSNPSNEDALRIWREVDQAVFLRLLAKGGEYESIARALMAKATPVLKASKKDTAAMEPLINDAIGADFAKRQYAIAKLMGEYGSYTIQGLVGPLSDAGDDNRRVLAMNVAEKMAGGGVPPLVALLNSTDPTLRRSAVVVLGRLRDPRALAPLAAVAESDTDSNVKADARRAAQAMGWQGAEGSSADLLLAQAMNYLRGEQAFVRANDANDVVWDLTDNKLVDAAISRSLYGTEMSRRSAMQSLGIRNENPRALGILAMAHCEARAVSAGLGEEALKAYAEKAPALNEELRLLGASALNTGLAMALEGNDARLANELLREIQDTTVPGAAVPSSVMAALRSKHREVRIQAAVSASTIDPNQATNVEIAKLLADGVGEKVQRIALIIDENADRRGAYANGFEGARWTAAPSDTGFSGLARLRRFSGVDLIVVSSTLKDLVAEQVIDELKADDRTKNIPIVVSVAAPADVEGAKTRFGANAKNVLAKFEAAPMDAAVEGAPMNPERVRAEELASNCARSLAHAPSLVEGAREAALAALSDAAMGRADAVRIPALRALERFGTANQQPAAVAVLNDASGSPAAKAHACDALAGIGSRGAAFSAEAITALEAAGSHADATVRAAAAGALGRGANVDAATRAKALRTKAVPLSAGGGAATKPAESAPSGGGSN